MGTIGELETLILLAVMRLGDDAYGVSVGEEIARCTGRRLTRGAIYSAVRRLEAKGLLEGSLGDATPERGGRAKRYVSVTSEGARAVRAVTRDLDALRSGLEERLAET